MFALDAVEAFNAVLAVQLALNVQIHRTEFGAFAAVVAGFFHPQGNDGDPVEQRINGSQWADGSAEGALDEEKQPEKEGKDSHLNPEHRSN